MMQASYARQITNYNLDQKLKSVYDAIKEAASVGQDYLTVCGNLSTKERKRLLEMGYRLSDLMSNTEKTCIYW